MGRPLQNPPSVGLVSVEWGQTRPVCHNHPKCNTRGQNPPCHFQTTPPKPALATPTTSFTPPSKLADQAPREFFRSKYSAEGVGQEVFGVLSSALRRGGWSAQWSNPGQCASLRPLSASAFASPRHGGLPDPRFVTRSLGWGRT